MIKSSEELTEEILRKENPMLNKPHPIKNVLTQYEPCFIDKDATFTGEGNVVYQFSVIRGPILFKGGVIVREFCNIWGTYGEIGQGVKIGAYTEIGDARIGDNVTIGAKCFIPPEIVIGDGAWIGPGCIFTNDKYPPSEKWDSTLVMPGARLGAGVKVVCGVVIGEGSLIGAGSVITKDIPAGEVWAGIPARFLRKVE